VTSGYVKTAMALPGLFRTRWLEVKSAGRHLGSRVLRRATKPLRDAVDRRRLGRLYCPEHNNTDRARHLSEAIEWLERAQDFGEDRGVSAGTAFGKGFLASYPETTGYIMQTFVELARRRNDSRYLARARAMGDWEIEVQLPSGAVMGGFVNKNPTPAVFNTGQVLLGWSALFGATGDHRYAEAARLACQWLMAMQEPDGRWVKGNSDFVLKSATLYNVKAAWGLCEAGVALGERAYVEAAIRNAEFCLRKQHPNGWFEDCCLSNPDRPLLHTIAYAMQGLVGIGKLTKREDFIDAADRTARSLQAGMRGDGFLAGCYDREFRGTVSWCCLTGSAQTSVVWSDLYLLGRDGSYSDSVRQVNDYLCRHHDVTNEDPMLRGGVPGSWPVWGEYCQYMVLNWATKFFVDALLREERVLGVS
jgi:hypothetical protein